MSEQANESDLHQDMLRAVDAARDEAIKVDRHRVRDYSEGLLRAEHIGAHDYESQYPLVVVRNDHPTKVGKRLGAKPEQSVVGDVTTRTLSSNTKYHSIITTETADPHEVIYAGTGINRANGVTGEKYEHVFHSPDTARKFGRIIAKQVERRARTEISDKSSTD